MFDLRVTDAMAAIPSRLVNPLGPPDQGSVALKWTSKGRSSPKCPMTIAQAFNHAVRQFVMGGWGPNPISRPRALFINRAGKLKWETPSDPIKVPDGTYGVTIIGRFRRDCDLLDILRALRARREYFEAVQ